MTNEFETPSAADCKRTIRPLVTESESFAAFDEWFNVALDQLVARWIHAAAPNARRISRGQLNSRRNAF